MSDLNGINEELQKPLDPKHVKRNERGYDYIESWHAEAEANAIFGHDGWCSRVLETEQVFFKSRQEMGQDRQGYYAAYRAVVEVRALGVTRQNVGHGEGYGSPGLAVENAEKEAVSDAEKRALKSFGWRFGLALYQKPQEREHVQKPQKSFEEKQKALIEGDDKHPGVAEMIDFIEKEGDEQHKAAYIELLRPFDGNLLKIPEEDFAFVYKNTKSIWQLAKHALAERELG